MASNSKIFGIGYPKTGTTSLGYALKILGFNHKTYDDKLNKKYNEGDYEYILSEAEHYDSFEDGPWNRGEFYKELDRQFPNSKFILTVRELQSWIKSHEKHFSAKHLRENPQELWRRDYNENKKAKIIAQYTQRNEGIVEYFKNRQEDLLVIDVCNGEGWEKLCPFLGIPVPTTPFPRTNVTTNRDLSTLGVWQEIIKRAVRKRKESLKHIVRQLGK